LKDKQSIVTAKLEKTLFHQKMKQGLFYEHPDVGCDGLHLDRYDFQWKSSI
jgi:hypothetical protein